MLEDFFVVPAAAQRLRDGALGFCLDGFCARLVELGYRPTTIRYRLWVVRNLTAWMGGARVPVTDLDEDRVEEFLRSRRRGHLDRGLRRSLRHLLEWLRASGAIPAAAAVSAVPMPTVLTRYAVHLRQERALAETTVTGYLQVAHELLVERLDGGAAAPASLRPSVVHEFLLTRVRRLVHKRAQYVSTALRSFLRFLFVRGDPDGLVPRGGNGAPVAARERAPPHPSRGSGAGVECV